MTANVTLVLGDITAQQVDAIVNAANNSLLGGGGVDGAIHEAAGQAMFDDCLRLRDTAEYFDGLPTGQAVATIAGDLQARWVIHAVGPIYDPAHDQSELLASCYREALRVADELGARVVAFPAISTGIYRWPLRSAAAIALSTLLDTPSQVAEARMVLFSQEVYDVFAEELARLRAQR